MKETITALEILSLQQFEKSGMSGSEKILTDQERFELSGKHIQSVAGFCAVKRALLQLCADERVGPHEFILSHGEQGEPCIVKGPVGIDISDIRISISHTKQAAYGIAVMQKDL